MENFNEEKNQENLYAEEIDNNIQAEKIDLEKSNKQEGKKSLGYRILYEIFEFAKIFCLALAIWFIVNAYFFEVNLVVGNSMRPNLQNRDRIIVNKISPVWRNYQRGDIITIDGSKLKYSNFDRLLVKRIIALPNDKVEIKEGKVFVNDELVKEAYLPLDVTTEKANGEFYQLKLAEDEYYVLGDNRGHSADSRIFGPVPKKAIKGYLIFRFYPFNAIGTVN